MINKYYIVRDNKIFRGTPVKKAKRGAIWFEITGYSKSVLVSPSKIFESENEAEKYLKDKNVIKMNKLSRVEKEIDKINDVLNNIYKEFSIECRFLDKPCTLKDAENLLYKLY